jgi:peptidylprolyl isomerase
LLRRTFLSALAGATLIATSAQAAAPATKDPENTLILTLKGGQVVIRLRPDIAPKHVERLKTLTRKGFYDGLKFHRVIEGFMAQTGDPRGDGTGGSDLPNLPAEFNPMPFERGVLGMARAQSPNSANSQFFIMFANGSFLNGQYTAFGDVISGMEFVDAIKRGDKAANGVVSSPDVIVKMQVAADVK